ncbi:hypothetical protein BS47DRAFT_1343712 [Hydnum rufescens UP504]|uniref:Uncharacterized protein n=1 Tax=Hydnum rufescens UP504 TaxID=1448309 RepID=A0A9P6DWM3_9AGAM|nr:hypothetical protein BS47DRAFT_1343712 [Hydnum rufescens UP504]
MASPLPPLSASVTRILSLTGFPPELKTKDIQAAFSEWDGVGGGFKIKWVDDTSLLLVFADAGVARLLANHSESPPSLTSPTSALTLQVKPYDGSDAQAVIFTVNNRRTNGSRASISIPNAHVRGPSSAGPDGSRSAGGLNSATRPPVSAWKNGGGSSGLSGSMHAPNASVAENGPSAGDVSPTLPNLTSQPTLNSLINSSLPDIASGPDSSNSTPSPAVLTPVPEPSPPRVGDPARRMVGAALGVKHPGITPKSRVDNADALRKAMGAIAIAE